VPQDGIVRRGAEEQPGRAVVESLLADRLEEAAAEAGPSAVWRYPQEVEPERRPGDPYEVGFGKPPKRTQFKRAVPAIRTAGPGRSRAFTAS
jgi:hypothetical protein